MPATKKYIGFLIFVLLVSSINKLAGQDNESPLSPQLTLVTVEASTGFSHLYWTPGGSPDVAGYVIYLYDNGLGEAVDTLYDPLAVDYLYTKTWADSYSVDYVIAAIDSSENVSPLSNPLSTIYLETRLDTCNHQLILNWNPYTAFPVPLTGYSVYISEDGAEESLAGSTAEDIDTFSYNDFKTDHTYCFRLEAELEGGSVSSSNLSCIDTDIINPPSWINGNYSSVDRDNNIELSFAYDPASEIELFRLEKAQAPEGPYNPVTDINNNNGEILVDGGQIENSVLYFRLAAINYCDNAVALSNIITVIPLYATISNKDVGIRWNAYKGYKGELAEYRIYRLINDQRNFMASINPSDTSYHDFLGNFIYSNNEENICYQVEAVEYNNPNTSDGVSISQTSCVDTPVGIYVPNAFTPDGDLLNDTFCPVLTFTPEVYRLFIKTRSGVTVFSTRDYLEHWDGKQGGKALQPGVYLWFIDLKTPGGKEITRNGTVTIIFN